MIYNERYFIQDLENVRSEKVVPQWVRSEKLYNCEQFAELLSGFKNK